MLLRRLAAAFVLASSVGVASAAAGQADTRADYIVTFSSERAMGAGVDAVTAAGGRIFHTYRHALNGVAVSLPAAAARALAARPGIASVELDAPVSIDVDQSNATWGLDRIDQRARPLNGTYTYDVDGRYGTGSRVDAYIIDTGILGTHVEFTGRMGSGFTAIKDRNGTRDCNGHGTHVAGTVGGTKYGVAKQVRLIPVRVLDCRGSGSNTGVIAGIDWVAANHQAGVPAVANMSLGGGVSTAINSAVANLVADGVVVVVAAGNETTDACTKSPASEKSAITVGATTSTDAIAGYSNYGSCVDILAPGSSITSAWYKSTSSINTISGTSMASPHVAGVAALILSENPAASVATVTSTIIGRATVGVVTGSINGSPNLLLYSRAS